MASWKEHIFYFDDKNKKNIEQIFKGEGTK